MKSLEPYVLHFDEAFPDYTDGPYQALLALFDRYAAGDPATFIDSKAFA